MKLKVFFKVLLIFLTLIFIQLVLALFFAKIIDIKVHEIFLLCVDLSYVIIIAIAVILWKLNIKNLFKKIPFKNILFLFIISVLIHLLFPIFNVVDLIENILLNKVGKIELSIDNFLNQDLSFFKGYRTLRLLILMPFLEEILYRGILLNKLREKYSSFAAVVISSFLFGLGHMELGQSISTFFSGLILGFIYLKSSNLSTVVLVHFFINLCTFFTKLEYTNPIRANEFIYYSVLIFLLFFLLKKFTNVIYPYEN